MTVDVKERRRRRQRYQNNAVPNEDAYFDVGHMNTLCMYCGAKRFKGEKKSICCANGQVELPPLPEAPEPLKSLLRNRHFQEKLGELGAKLETVS